MPDAGDPILVEDFPPTQTDTETTAGTTTSTSLTATLTGGTACSVVFSAPTSGRVLILNTCRIDNDSTGIGRCAFRVGAGATPGAGTEILAASTNRAVTHQGGDLMAATFSYVLEGLTAGNTYNVLQMFSVSAGTGTFDQKQLVVTPLP